MALNRTAASSSAIPAARQGYQNSSRSEGFLAVGGGGRGGDGVIGLSLVACLTSDYGPNATCHLRMIHEQGAARSN
jgi:hypothetical protein